MTHSRSLIIQV